MESSHFSMTWDSFAKCILQIQTLSDELGDEWKLHGNTQRENGAYISKRLRRTFEEIVTCDLLQNLEESSLDAEEGAVTADETLLTFDYHVVYNPNYSCPVLCFNAWRMNGTLLSLEECWEKFNFFDVEDKYTVLTQMDHGVLMSPYLTLHPCKTGELIGSFTNSKNVVVSWLSAVGPVVGLNVSPAYAKLTF